jgi:hypothetical protein
MVKMCLSAYDRCRYLCIYERRTAMISRHPAAVPLSVYSLVRRVSEILLWAGQYLYASAGVVRVVRVVTAASYRLK